MSGWVALGLMVTGAVLYAAGRFRRHRAEMEIMGRAYRSGYSDGDRAAWNRSRRFWTEDRRTNAGAAYRRRPQHVRPEDADTVVLPMHR